MTYSASFAINSTSFRDAATWALKGFEPNADNSYILFEVDTKKSVLAVSSVSLQYYFKDTVGLDSFEYLDSDEDAFRSSKDDTIRFAVDGGVLSRVVSVLPKGKNMKVKESVKNGMRTLTLAVPGQRFELSLLENKRPPASPEITVLGETQASDLSYALKSLTRISDVSGASAVPALGALAFKVNSDDDKLDVMATDTYALAEVKLGFSAEDSDDDADEDEDASFLIHSTDAALLVKDAMDPESTIELGVDSNQKVAFLFGNGRIACVSKLDEEPIDYQSFKREREDEKSVVVDTRAFSDAVKVANKLSWETDDVFVTLSENSLVVTNTENSSTIEVPYNEELTDTDSLELGDEGLETNFSYTVISKSFHPILTPHMKISFVTNDQFFRATPVLDSGNDQEGVFILFVPVIKKRG